MKNRITVLETVTDQDFSQANFNWGHFHGKYYPKRDSGKTFMEFLGVKHVIFGGSGVVVTRVEVAHKIRLLLSPHYETVIKAWYAKKLP